MTAQRKVLHSVGYLLETYECSITVIGNEAIGPCLVAITTVWQATWSTIGVWNTMPCFERVSWKYHHMIINLYIWDVGHVPNICSLSFFFLSTLWTYPVPLSPPPLSFFPQSKSGSGMDTFLEIPTLSCVFVASRHNGPSTSIAIIRTLKGASVNFREGWRKFTRSFWIGQY